MAHDLGTNLDQLLPQAGQRPLRDRLGQGQRPHEVGEIVGQRVQLKTHRIGGERAARQSRPLDRVLAFFDPLLARPALVVEGDDPLHRSRQVGDNETDAGIKLAGMPLDLGNDGESCDPRSRCMGCKIHGAWYRTHADAIDVFCSPSDYLLRAHAAAGVVLKCSAHVRNGVARRTSLPGGGRPSEDRPIRYLYMGQLAAHKGIDSLIGAIRLASGSAFTIDIAGRGDGEARLEALAGAEGRVRFHGFVDGERKDRLLSSSDVLIFPSIWVENAPMSIAEAFCHGLPVIGSRIGAIPEFVEHGTNGLLFEAGNATSLATCMMELSERPDELRPLKQGASRSGNSWPTPETMASDYVDIYRSLLQRIGPYRQCLDDRAVS